MAQAAHKLAPNPHWHETLPARAILASIKAIPPKCEVKRLTFAITAETYHVYVGERVEQLTAIRDAAGEACLFTEAFDAWCAAPTVAEAIDAVLA